MAAFTQNSNPLSSFFPTSSSKGRECPGDGQVDVAADGKATADFGNRPAGGFRFPGSRTQNEQKGYAISEMADGGENFSCRQSAITEGTLNVTIHHARDIHNICIYGNQDVYAKFSLTSSQDETFSTQSVKSGGRNPVFNQNFQIPISCRDPILKCEIWMLSGTRTYLEDQLLGFVLVPLAWLVGKGNVTQDYMLSSTELFHTPVGSVCLSLALTDTGRLPDASYNEAHDSLPAYSSPSSSEFMLMDAGDHGLPIRDYNKIEFPDLEAASENHHIISLYFNVKSGDLKLESESNAEACAGSKLGDYGEISAERQGPSRASFLQLNSSPMVEADSEMALNMGKEKPVEKCQRGPELFNVSCVSSIKSPSYVAAPVSHTSVNAVPCSTEDQKVTASQEHNSNLIPNVSSSGTCLGISGSVSSTVESLDHSSYMMKENKDNNEKGTAISNDDKGVTCTTSLVNTTLEPEEPVVQQQIVDMYMKGMQQFTESLANMKLPLDLDAQGQTDCADTKALFKGTKAGQNEKPKVFYGSRAFF
eukprot:c29052_g3_i1 orf=754-2355(+)